jgi:thiosulfate dehydrogenase
MKHFAPFLLLLFFFGCSNGKETAPFSFATQLIPAGPEGEKILLGRELAQHTKKMMPEYVGAGLACFSCHLDAGRKPYASPWIGLSHLYPEYFARDHKVISLEYRINDCFERSMNGKPLPSGDPRMEALLAYINWLSRGVASGTSLPGRGLEALRPPREPLDRERGRQIFLNRCAFCHSDNGGGMYEDNVATYPALWGDRSFNDAAGMNDIYKMAAFIQVNMPLYEERTLSPQEAYDVAAFITSQPRPHYKPN